MWKSLVRKIFSYLPRLLLRGFFFLWFDNHKNCCKIISFKVNELKTVIYTYGKLLSLPQMYITFIELRICIKVWTISFWIIFIMPHYKDIAQHRKMYWHKFLEKCTRKMLLINLFWERKDLFLYSDDFARRLVLWSWVIPQANLESKHRNKLEFVNAVVFMQTID